MIKTRFPVPLFIVISLLFSCHAGIGGMRGRHSNKVNTIDTIATAAAAQHFVETHTKRFKNFKVRRFQDFESKENYAVLIRSIADSLKIEKSFYKADFDHNGLTDMLVTGEDYRCLILVLLSFPDDSVFINPLTRRFFQDCIFPVVKSDGNIDLYYAKDPYGFAKISKPEMAMKTLTYKFGDFIEKNANPPHHKINRIEYQTEGCYGACPIFTLTLTGTGDSKFVARAFNFDEHSNDGKGEGEYATTLNSKHWNELVEILNYIDFPQLSDRYNVNWTDDQTSTLVVDYDDGKTKVIRDYGLLGTYGLQLLYHKLFEIRKNQNWIKIK